MQPVWFKTEIPNRNLKNRTDVFRRKNGFAKTFLVSVLQQKYKKKQIIFFSKNRQPAFKKKSFS